MRPPLRVFLFLALFALLSGPMAGAAGSRRWRQVHPYWQNAYIASFRSPDLLTNDRDERWGREDGRLACGGILTDFPNWLAEQAEAATQARKEGRPILIALHTHGGYGTGLVTYREDIQKAEVANYPWLMRQLEAHGLASDDVTVTIDTCNAQASAAHQIRPDLIPRGVETFPDFVAWRKQSRARQRMSLRAAYQVFERDRVARELFKPARGKRENVTAAPLIYLKPEERAGFKAHLYGSRGVILATPTFFNVLRLGPRPRGVLTANLLTDRLGGTVLNTLLGQNKADFRRFTEYAFLNECGLDVPSGPNPRPVASAREVAPPPAIRGHVGQPD